MKRKNVKEKRFTKRAIILTAALSVLGTVGAVALAAWLVLGSSGLAVTFGAALINTSFVGEYDEDEMADAALEAMVESLGDRWSYYADAEYYEYLLEKRTNSYVGIGVTVTYEADGLHIQSVAEGGPAEEAGLLAGEIIIKADGHDLSGDQANGAASYIQGEEGTTVVLTVLDGKGVSRLVEVTRARIVSSPVKAKMLDGQIGYVALSNFYQDSGERVIAEVESLIAQGAQGLIFDMRDNPGGYLAEMIDMLDYLLPEGPIFQSGNRRGPNYTAKSDEHFVDLPMVVLVNENSYSAAELFAAQLRESAGAPIVGQPTCGKGHFQMTFPLPGGRGLNLSTNTYYTGAGESLIGVGINPDKVIDLTDGTDSQLEAALALLTE